MPPRVGQPKLLRAIRGANPESTLANVPQNPTQGHLVNSIGDSMPAPGITAKPLGPGGIPQGVVPVNGRGLALPSPRQQAPIQMHGIYTNNPGFVEKIGKDWTNYSRSQPPADLAVPPAKVNVQLREGKLPYGKMPKQMRFDSSSAFLPSPAPATPGFGNVLI